MDALGVISFFFQAEGGIRDSSTSRGRGDVYKRQLSLPKKKKKLASRGGCLLYTSDAADDLTRIDVAGGRSRIQTKKIRRLF